MKTENKIQPDTCWGLDLGLSATGWARANGQAGVVESKFSGPERLIDISAQLHECGMWQAAGVAVEGYSFASRYCAHQLGELGGRIRCYLWETRIPYVIVPPQTAKKYASGKATSKKDEMRLWVFKRWAAEFDTEHEVDAYVLAKIAYAVFADGDDLLKEQRAIIQKLRGQITRR